MKPHSPTQANYYRDQAQRARAEAEAATLDNVRERCLRSVAVWESLAARAERVTAERVARDRATAERMGRD